MRSRSSIFRPLTRASAPLRGGCKFGQQCAQARIRDHILGARLNLKKRAIDIKKICGAR